MARKDQVLWSASLLVDPAAGWVPIGAFRTGTGGQVTRSSLKSRPAAGQGEVERGGRKTVSNLTLTREDDGSLDLQFLSNIDISVPMRATRQVVDDDGNPLGTARTYTGKLLEVNVGDGDAEDTGTKDDFSLVMGCDNAVS